MGNEKAAVVWAANVPQSTNSTRHQRASVLDSEYDCDFFVFGDPERSANHDFDVSLCVERGGVVSGLSFFARTAFTIAFARRSEYEMVHTSYHPLVCLLGCLCSISGLRWVHDIWDHPVLTVPSPSKDMTPDELLAFIVKYIPYRLSLRALSRVNTVVLSLHHSITESIPVPETDLVHVPNGTDLDLYANVTAPSSESFTVVYVGEVSRTRGARTMLQVAALLAAELDDFSLVLIGEVRDREWLDETIEMYDTGDCVVVTGRLKHRAALERITAADAGLCLFPGSTETKYIYPIKVFEYMALETIPVCTDLPGMADVLTDGETGYLVRSGDARGAAGALLAVANTETNELTSNATKAVRQYNWQELNEQFRSAIASS